MYYDFECGICCGPLELLGVLGSLAHVRCRNCGAQYHLPAIYDGAISDDPADHMPGDGDWADEEGYEDA